MCHNAENSRHFADDIFKRIFSNENVRISIKISLKFVLQSPTDNKSVLVQIMSWRRTGEKPLSETMLSLLTVSLGGDELIYHYCISFPRQECVLRYISCSIAMVLPYSKLLSMNISDYSQYLGYCKFWRIKSQQTKHRPQINTLGSEQYGCHFAGDNFKCIGERKCW